MSLDLTGEPFPTVTVDIGNKGGGGSSMGGTYIRCRDGHIDLWYDSTDCPKCPLCAVMRREWGLG